MEVTWPRHRPSTLLGCFCIRNKTCVTNAPNSHARVLLQQQLPLFSGYCHVALAA
jgi:hypothetical protein